MTTAGPIRVLLVDDQVLIRQSLGGVLHGFPNLELIGEASDGEEALGYVEKLKPSVVLMDINMPRMDGVTATRLIKTRYPDVAVVGVTITAEGYQQSAMRRAGAYEVLSKTKTGLQELYATLQSAATSIELDKPKETSKSDQLSAPQ
jgi:DNA-binding NarL/FixJ family response regulator